MDDHIKYYKGSVKMTWAHVGLVFINAVVLTPIGAWLTNNYYAKRQEHIYNARRPKLVLTFNIIALIFIGVYCPAHVVSLEVLWRIRGNYGFHSLRANGSLFAAEFVLFLTLALRIWHSFYG